MRFEFCKITNSRLFRVEHEVAIIAAANSPHPSYILSFAYFELLHRGLPGTRHGQTRIMDFWIHLIALEDKHRIRLSLHYGSQGIGSLYTFHFH